MDSENRQHDSSEDRKGARAAVSLDVEFVAKAIDAAGLGVLAVDRGTGEVVYVSAAGADMLDSLSELSQTDALDTVARAMLAAAGSVGFDAADPARTLTVGDRVVGFSVYLSKDALWAFFRDVTERVRASTVAESLQLSDALLGVFSTLRHDLGNSVNAAKTSLHVLRHGLGRHDETAVRRYVDRTLEALAGVETVLGIMRDYGFASRPQLRSVLVGEMVERAALECGRGLAERGAILDVEMEAVAVAVLADPGILEQALCDLVSRAERRVRAEAVPRVVVRVEERRDTLVIRVSPRGPCDQAPDGPPEDGDLRLLIVRRLISQMEGTFAVEGSDSVITLRRAPDR